MSEINEHSGPNLFSLLAVASVLYKLNSLNLKSKMFIKIKT